MDTTALRLAAREKLLFFVVTMAFYLLSVLFYSQNSSALFQYAGMYFDGARFLYALPIVLTYIFLFCLVLPNQIQVSTLFVLVLHVFVVNSILTTAIHFNSLAQVYSYTASLFLSMAVITLIGRFRLKGRMLGSQYFETIVFILFLLCLLPILLQAARSGLRFASFAVIYELRADLNLGTAVRYGMSFFVFSIGPLMIAIGLTQKKPIWVLLSFGTYVLCYMLTFQKSNILAPLWVAGVFYIFQKLKPSNSKILLFLGIPFFFALFTELILQDGHLKLVITGIFGTRMYFVPGQVFAHYVDFFEVSPHTFFSHIRGISSFIEYPYLEQLPLVIRNYYPGGNQNANFFAQDAIAGAGIWAMPLVSLLFAFVLVVLNSVTKNLDLRFVMTACTMAAQRFSDGTLATGLVSGGIFILLVLLFLSPRCRYGTKQL